MSFKPMLGAFALLSMFTFGAAAQTITITPELAKIIEAAKAEGKIVLKSNPTFLGGPAGVKATEQGLNKMFGTNLPIEWTPGPAFAPLAASLFQEMQGGQKSSTDVYFGTAIQVTPYLQRNLWKATDWAKLLPGRIQPEFVEGEGRALRFMTFLPGILYNLKAAAWVPQVKTSADLLKPEYKSKFLTTPFLAGFDVMLAIWGQQRTEEYVRQMSKQVSGLMGCEAFERIASGELPALALDCTGAAPENIAYRGKDVLGLQVIHDIAQRRYAYFTIPTNAPHPNAAILYTLYLSTSEGQKNVVWNYYGQDLDGYPDAATRKKVDELTAAGVKFTDVTIDWWKTNSGVEKGHLELTKIVRER
jgi:iron(III) transport system substrate-binding protein